MKNKSIGFFLSLVTAAVALIALIVYFVYASKNEFNALIVVSLIVVIAAELCASVFKSKILAMYLPVLAPVFGAIATFSFITDTVGTFVDFFTGVGIFGDITQIGIITAICILSLIASVLSIVACFFRKEKPAAASLAKG